MVVVMIVCHGAKLALVRLRAQQIAGCQKPGGDIPSSSHATAIVRANARRTIMIDLIRFVHVLGAAVLFGTGLGIAFFMVMANRTGDPARIAHVASTVVIADTIFTATAVILQPISGALLAREIGWALSEGWIVLSLLLYVVTGLFWLPVVWRPDQAAQSRPPGRCQRRTFAASL